MKNVILSVLFLSGIANAATYECGSLKLTVFKGAQNITLVGSDLSDKLVKGTLTKYRPSAKNAGSTRYDITSVCQSSGDVYAILDKDLSEGKVSGTLTIQSTCDADGGAPSFERYSCLAQ